LHEKEDRILILWRRFFSLF